MTAKAAGDKPAPVSLNLDDLERDNAPGPYVFVLGGRRWETRDPLEMSWQEVMDLDEDNPQQMVRALVVDPDAFVKLTLPAWKLEALARALQQHYLGALMPQGEDDGSPAS